MIQIEYCSILLKVHEFFTQKDTSVKTLILNLKIENNKYNLHDS